FQESTVLIRSGSSLVFEPVDPCHWIAGSRCHECRMSSGSTDLPVSSSDAFICAHTSAFASALVHRLAGLPYRRPGVVQSETSTDRQSTAVPSPYVAAKLLVQCGPWEMAVSDHGESMKAMCPAVMSA